MSIAAEIVAEARAQSLLEFVAVVSAVLYLVLVIRENIWCWLFGVVSPAIYVWLLFGARLYMESLLNGFYVAMAIYGWYQWTHGRAGGDKKPVVEWNGKLHALAIAGTATISVLNGLLLDRYTDAAYPYIDSMTTWFALWATFLVAQKVLENWWYWLAIDVTLVFVFWNRELYMTSVLFAVYVLLIPVGYLSWRRSMLGRSAP